MPVIAVLGLNAGEFPRRDTVAGFNLIAGNVEQTVEKLLFYTEHRLLGDHVPYPIEAWPEGEKRHLSAESALYCRVITEGMLGLEPASSHSFRVAPHLPEQCGSAALREIRAFGKIFDLTVDRESIKVTCRGITKIYPAEGGIVDLAEF